ncbi:amino acid permease [Trueperella pecoris]|uniref:APC family permease n=1 Tax=Trueperella pecoris TaxID=2733571 RepID=A0A7M1QZ62_9ACTO|nr:amino acid permease [Trueperella pecoris]QOR46467.1 APC family permease [Trueperella pecoris]QTG76293.1 APC family permease [Trueperella pecoris]
MLNFRAPHSRSEIVEAVTRSTSLSIIALCMVIVPQIVLRSASYSEKSVAMLWALFSAVASLAAAIYIAGLLQRHVPRRSSHQLAGWNIGHWAGLLVSAARILAYALVVILGVELATNSLETQLNISWSWVLDPILILLIAIGVLVIQVHHRPWMTFFTVTATLGVIALLGYGLIEEAAGSVDFENIRLAREDAYNTERSAGVRNSMVEAALGGAMLGGATTLISERILNDTNYRRVSRRRLTKFMTGALIVIAITLYFSVVLRMPGQRVAVPALSMSYAFFGEKGQLVFVVLFVMLGVGVATAAYGQLPRLLRELALDGLLPRRLAAADAVAPRRAIVAIIALLAAIVTIVLDSARSIATVFVFTVYILVAIVSLAMISRSKTILNDSTEAKERRRATGLAWIFRAYALFALFIAGAVVYAQPMWALAGIVALSVPVVFLVAYSRGQSKLSHQLRLGDMTFGRKLPTRVHGVVIIEKVDSATIQAVTWARAMRLSTLTAICVDIDPRQTRQIRQAWEAALVPVDLTILGEPKGAWRGPVVEYIRARLTESPNDVMNVVIPRVIYSSSWERFFLRHSTPRVISDLRFEPRVMITEAPYRLGEEE